MNKRDWIVLSILVKKGHENLRSLAKHTGFSLGLVHSSLKTLQEFGYIDQSFQITDKTREYLEQMRPQRAVILAAGMGSRMTPLNTVPKGTLTVGGIPVIERIIQQLNEVGITEIYLVVGYMREAFDYLIDKYNVSLIHNNEYATTDSLHSLVHARDKLKNCYIVPSSVWFSRNPFNNYEYFSWYAVSEYIDDDSCVRLNRKLKLRYTPPESGGNAMVGMGYLAGSESALFCQKLALMSNHSCRSREPWETALFDGDQMMVYARVMRGQTAYNIKTCKELRELDDEFQHLRDKRRRLIGQVLHVSDDEITEVPIQLSSMTNRMMCYSVRGVKYLLREPGEGSNELTSRTQEVAVYQALEGTGLSDKVIYISPETGYKISEYYENSRRCDDQNMADVAACIRHTRKLHELRLEVGHAFSLRERLQDYESLRGETAFKDYAETRAKIDRLLDLVESLPRDHVLCHIDAVKNNFLFVDGEPRLIDWEYAGMCDPSIDVAMFCISSLYDKKNVDTVIDIYSDGNSALENRFKIYAYISSAALLWSVWGEYKKKKGVDFGEYTINRYHYAKEYYRYAMALAQEIGIV